jgi:hypothetical protein
MEWGITLLGKPKWKFENFQKSFENQFLPEHYLVPKIGHTNPQIIHFTGLFAYKPSSYWGTAISGTPRSTHFIAADPPRTGT